MGEINGRVAVNSGPVIKSRTGVNHGKALPHFAAGLAPRNAVRLKSSVHREPHDRGETRGVYTTAPGAGSSGSFSRVSARPSVRTRRPRPPPLDARLAPRRSRDPGGAPNRRVEVRDASERAEAVRRCQLRGDLRQARAGSRPLQGAYRAIGTRRRVGWCFVPGGHRTGAVHRRCYVARADRHLGSRRLGTAILYFQKRPAAISSPIPPTHPTHHFPHIHSTGKSRVPRRCRQVLPLRAPRHQPHRQRGRYPGLLETAAEDARLLAT